jgi:phage shock protein A
MERYYTGSPRTCLAQAVEDAKKELMARDRDLTELAAHRKAIELTVKANPEIVKSYRMDARSA